LEGSAKKIIKRTSDNEFGVVHMGVQMMVDPKANSMAARMSVLPGTSKNSARIALYLPTRSCTLRTTLSWTGLSVFEVPKLRRVLPGVVHKVLDEFSHYFCSIILTNNTLLIAYIN